MTVDSGSRSKAPEPARASGACASDAERLTPQNPPHRCYPSRCPTGRDRGDGRGGRTRDFATLVEPGRDAGDDLVRALLVEALGDGSIQVGLDGRKTEALTSS